MRGIGVKTLAVVGCCAIAFAAQGQDQQKKSDPHVLVLGDTDANGKPATDASEAVPVTNVALPEEKLDHGNKLELIRALNAEIAYARRPLPKLDKGLVLPANGRLEPGADQLRQELIQFGVAAKKGDRVQITDMLIEERDIKFVLNGGAKTKHKWYEHVAVGMGGAEVAPLAKGDNPNAKGTTLTLTFPKYVPQVSAEQVRELLSPVLDFTVKSPMQAYADTLPPHIKQAVLDHEALVGMNHEMVLAALGRPDKKFRGDEATADTDIEDWMYGKPPATVKFLRFKGDQLVRIKEMPVGQEAVVRDKPEIEEAELAGYQSERKAAVDDRKAAREASNRPAPTMRRSGDDEPVVPTQSETVSVKQQRGGAPNGTTPPTIDPSTQPGAGDGQSVPGRAPIGTQAPGTSTSGQPPQFPGSPGDGGSGPR